MSPPSEASDKPLRLALTDDVIPRIYRCGDRRHATRVRRRSLNFLSFEIECWTRSGQLTDSPWQDGAQCLFS